MEMKAYFCPLNVSYFSTCQHAKYNICKIYMQDKYVNMQAIYVNMQLIYGNMRGKN